MGNPTILEELRPALRSSIAALAEDLLGPPNTQNGRELRWGAKGSFRVIISGPKQGACCDFESGWKGDPLALIMRERRTDFQGAIAYGCQFVGIAFDGKSKPEDPAERAAREAERERKRAETRLEQKAAEAERIAYARNLWNASGPIDGTAALEYLAVTRAIPRPATGWPDATVRYHAGTASLILAGTNAVGEVCFVQRIALTVDGRKIDGTPKITNGVMAGCYMRLPGPKDGPLLLAEGPETALSVWSAGYETWASVGSITRHTPPVGRQVVVCRDDDRLQSPTNQALKRSMSAWHAADIDAVVATPWDVRREDKSDFNDLIQVDGVEAVKRRIRIALEPPHDPISRLAIEAGGMALRKAIDGFFSQLPRADATFVHAVKIDVGAGKSEISLQNIALTIRQMRRDGDRRICVVAVPTHALGDQQMTRFLAMFNAKGISAGVWRSREADADGQPMCLDRGAVIDANEALADVQTSVCQRKMPDGTVRECEHFAECRFQKQRNAKSDVMFVPHEIIYGQKPAGVGKPAFLVVDESSWADGLFGCDDRLWLLLDTLISENAVVPDSPLSTGQLESSRRALHAALAEILQGATKPDEDTRLPAVRAILLKHGLCAETANECYALEWKRKTEAEIYPGMPPRKRKEAVAAVIHNKIVRKLGVLWKSVAHLLANNGPEKSGYISIGLIKSKDGCAPAIFMKGRLAIHDDWQIPTLILDATLQPDLVRHFWPTMQVTADIRIQTPHQHVTQVIDRSYSKTQLGKAAGLRDVHAIICRESRRYKGRVLVVVQQEIEEALPGIGPLPRNVELAHHNAVEGKDHWGPGPDRNGVEALIVVGRTAPSPIEVEKMAEALTGAAIERHQGWYPKASTAREMADGTFRPAESDRHPDAVAEAIRWQIAEGQLVQIIGRARGVNRTKDNPVDVLVMTNAPLPIPVERLISTADLDPAPADLMMAAGGVSLENPTNAATAYPHLWATRNAAKKAMEKRREGRLGSNRNKDSLITERPQPPFEVSYQRAGPGCSKATAYVDLTIVPGPEAWLTERLGPLANFALGPANQEAVVGPSLPAIPGGYGEGLDPVLLFPHLVRPADPLEGFRVRRPQVGLDFGLPTLATLALTFVPSPSLRRI